MGCLERRDARWAAECSGFAPACVNASACLTQRRRVSVVQPSFSDTDFVAAHRDECSPRACSNSRTARSRTSAESRLLVLMTPLSQHLESPEIPGRFNSTAVQPLGAECRLGHGHHAYPDARGLVISRCGAGSVLPSRHRLVHAITDHQGVGTGRVINGCLAPQTQWQRGGAL